jgi:hypothetical protein
MLFVILWVLFSLVIAGVAKQTGRNPGFQQPVLRLLINHDCSSYPSC